MTDKISLTQAIFQISNLTDELRREEYRLSNELTGPVAQNGKKSVTEDMKAEANEVMKNVEELLGKLLKIREAVNKANNQEIEGRTIISLIDEVKESHIEIPQTLIKTLIKNGYKFDSKN